MRTQTLMAAFGIFMVGTILAVIASGRWRLAGEVGIFNALASFNAVDLQAGGGYAVPKGLALYWDALVTMLTWNYPFLDSAWAIFIKIPLWTISIGVVWGILQMAIGVLSGIVGAIRSAV